MVFGYDAMYGTGQLSPRLLPDIVAIHCDDNPGFKGCTEPLHKIFWSFLL